MWGQMFSELWRYVVERESVESTEIVAEICKKETSFYITCKGHDVGKSTDKPE